MTFLASLRSEFLKTKRTSVIYLVLIAALVVPFVMVLDHGSPDPAKPANGCDNYYREGFMVFAFIFLPFFFLLTSTLLLPGEGEERRRRHGACPQIIGLHAFAARRRRQHEVPG